MSHGSQPLAGKRVVITRAHHQAGALARELEALGASVISIPTIEIRPPQSYQPLDKALAKLPKYDWLIVTSANGVQALRRRMEKLAIAPTLLRHLCIAAIGPATREELVTLGVNVQVMPTEYVAESVVSALKEQVPGKQILLVRAKVARDVIPRLLRDAGAEVDVAEAYETIVPPNSGKRLQENLDASGRLQADAVTFTSSSTVRNFSAVLPSGLSPKIVLAKVVVASIGPVTTATLKEIGVDAGVEAREFTVPGLVSALAEHFASGKPTG